MGDIISLIFNGLSKAFDAIPVLNRFKGYRTMIGFLVLAAIHFCDARGLTSNLSATFDIPVYTFIGLSLNAKGR